jgi:hypothetical protein
VGLAAAQEWLRRTESGNSNASILDYMVNTVWVPMGGSEVLFNSRVTYDSTEQPFAAYGLFYLPNDAALLATLMNTADGGMISGPQVYDATVLATALDNSCPSCGLPAGNYFYKTGVWKWKPKPACEYIPFSSVYGGIIMVAVEATTTTSPTTMSSNGA